METSDLKHHYSQQFNSELEEIRTRVLGMGGLVESQLEMAIAALNRGEVDSAEFVVANDLKVNACDVDIDDRCITILALRQPTASDLRLVLAVLKTTAELERIGDETKLIARAASDDWESSLFKQTAHLGEKAQRMLHGALDAFARMDVDAAMNVVDEDINIDDAYEAFVRQATSFMMEDPTSVPRVLKMIWAARALERIGDRCCNISEHVIYFVKGKDVRHSSLEQIKKELNG